MFKYAKLFLAVLLLVGCTKEPEPRPTTPLIVKTGTGDVRFSVEVAKTPEELKTGLMHRSTLAFNSGMIFNIYPVRPTAMWMKDTKISLDMLFVGPDGSIIKIVEATKPMSENLIISEEPVRAVIELNAGQVKRHNIKIGDKVNHMLINNLQDIKTPGPEAQNTPAANAAPAAPKADIPVPELPAEPKAAAAAAPGLDNSDITANELENLINPQAKVAPAAPKAEDGAAPKAAETPAAPAPKLPVPAPM